MQFFFSSVFQCEASGQVEISHPNGSDFVRTLATFPLFSNAARIRTILIHRPDGTQQAL